MNITLITSTLRRHAPSILTGLAVGGVVGTAIFSAQAGVKAHRIILHEGLRDSPFQDKLRATWKVWIPPLAVGAVTISSVIGVHSILARRVAVAASAAALAESQFDAYRKAAEKVVGSKKEEEIRAEAPKHRGGVRATVQEGDVLCFESYTGRYFSSTVDKIWRAVNQSNNEINNYGQVAANDFFIALGMDSLHYGDDYGWNTDHLIEPLFSSGVTEDGEPYLVLDYRIGPSYKYDRIF